MTFYWNLNSIENLIFGEHAFFIHSKRFKLNRIHRIGVLLFRQSC